MHMQARMQAWDGGEGKIKNLRKGIAEVSLSKAATVPFQTQIILVSREHPEDSLGIIGGDTFHYASISSIKDLKYLKM